MTTLPTDTSYKAVDFVATFTGRAFFPLAPKPEAITIIDIAHHLSNQVRYNGSARVFYSTAQHCCLLTDYVEKNVQNVQPIDCLQMLMHDAAEAWLIDVPRPIKQHMPQYRKWDYDVTMCVRSWLGLDGVPIPSWQDEFDSRIIADEREQIMNPSQLDWQHDVEPLGVLIEPWEPALAEQQFLMRWSHFSVLHYGSHQYLRSGWGVPTNSRFQPNFRTGGSDIVQQGECVPRVVTDLLEVDIRGGCGRVALRSPNGMMLRDRQAGSFPRPAWEFIHGKFELGVGNVE